MGLPNLPPKASPAFCVPAPAKLLLAFIKPPPADHTAGTTFRYENSTLPPLKVKPPDMLVWPVIPKVDPSNLKLDSATAELVVPSDVNILLSPGVDIVLNPVPLVPDVPLEPFVPAEPVNSINQLLDGDEIGVPPQPSTSM